MLNPANHKCDLKKVGFTSVEATTSFYEWKWNMRLNHFTSKLKETEAGCADPEFFCKGCDEQISNPNQ